MWIKSTLGETASTHIEWKPWSLYIKYRLIGLDVTPILKMQSLRPIRSLNKIIWSLQWERIFPHVACASGRHLYRRSIALTSSQSKLSAVNESPRCFHWTRSSLGTNKYLRVGVVWMFSQLQQHHFQYNIYSKQNVTQTCLSFSSDGKCSWRHWVRTISMGWCHRDC